MVGKDDSEAFGTQLTKKELESLQLGTQNVIAGLEVLGAVQAIKTWKDRIANRRVFVFVDNDAARANLIKMSTPVESMSKVLKELVQITMVECCFIWYCRVPSSSNPGDAPSRLEELEVMKDTTVWKLINLSCLEDKWKARR